MDKQTFFRNARNDLAGPLDGVRVLDVSTTWAGPLCGAILADFGADVLKVETPDGEVGRRLPPFLPGHEQPLSFIHATANRNKRNMTLDLHQEEAQGIFRRLVETADIFIENFKPGTMASWGFGYDDLAAVKPDLIYVSISGWGQFGPLHDRPGYDPLAQAAGGYAAQNGDPEGGPVKSATWLADDLGGMNGALAALAALRHRDQTGEGQHIDVSLLDGMIAGSNGSLTLGALGVPLPRMGNEFVFAAPASIFACSDGHMFLGVLLDTHWKTLAQLIGKPELADDERFATTLKRLEQRDTVNALMAEWCSSRTKQEVEEAFAREGIPAAPVRSYAEAAEDPHVLERDMLQTVPQFDGKEAPITGPAAKFSRTPTSVRTGAAALGAHTDEVLEELGFDAAAREELRAKGVV